MESILEIIFIVALLSYSIRASLASKIWIFACYALVMPVFALLLYPVVIHLPLTVLGDLLSTRSVVENISLLVTAESVLMSGYCLHMITQAYLPPSKPKIWAKLLNASPSLIAMCAVAYFELLFFKQRAGEDFLQTSLIYSGIMLAGVTGMAMLFRYLFRECSVRYELMLMFNIGILILGLLTSSAVAEYNTSNAITKIEWGALLSILAIALVLIFLGLYLHQSNIISKFKTLIKWNK